MELWIRSQDKINLVKIKQISVNYRDNRQIIANYIPEMYENAGEYYELLGTYETKERALEILDEIQNILKPKIIVQQGKSIAKTLDGVVYRTPDEVEIKELSVVVYEMPEV